MFLKQTLRVLDNFKQFQTILDQFFRRKLVYFDFLTIS